MSIVAYSMLLVICGWLLRGAVGGQWRKVKHAHRFGDSDHYWVQIDGRPHAFTDDQLEVAADRAEFLEDPRRRLGRIAAWSLIILGLLAVMFLSSCGYARRVDPALYTYSSADVARLSAVAHVKEDPAYELQQNVCCGSMRPLIQTGDWIVTKRTPYGEHLLGKVTVYRAQWNKGQPVMHRLVSGSAKEGFIASGDNNAHSEASERVTAANYISEVVAIYRYVPAS